MAELILDDINGDPFLGLMEGEDLIEMPANVYLIPHGVPQANAPLEKVALTVDQAMSIIIFNAFASKTAEIRDDQAWMIGYSRMLAIRHGLVSTKFLPGDFKVNYSEVSQLTAEDSVKISDRATKAGFTFATLAEGLSDNVKKELRKSFVDRVCMVAFVFRARGHHWTVDYDALYARVWGRTRIDQSWLHLPWKLIAINCFHAIYPIVLDQAWVTWVNENKVNGALAKRLDVAPAGSAGPFVIQQGLTDLLMIAPGLSVRFSDELKFLNDEIVKHSNARWYGSVNARYYGAIRGVFDERRLSSIAATIIAAVNNLTPGEPIGESPALKRIAKGAPITGAVIGRAIRNVSDRPEVVNGLMNVPND